MEDPLVGVHHVTKRYGSQLVVDDVSLQIQRGEFFSLLGSSGCGKSTTLRMIAGFETPDAGEIRLGNAAPSKIPAYITQMNMVFQNYALFPHMTVAENVGFGLKMQGLAAATCKCRVAEMLDLVQLSALSDRLPRQLSGGQQQRVALARALAPQPQIVLLDEPLGALDLKLRKEMQRELKQIQQQLGLTFIYVTHDQEEALTMSDRLCVMHAGRVAQIGTPEEIYHQPSSKFVADFIGDSNFLTGTISKHSPGQTELNVNGLTLQAQCLHPIQMGDSVTLTLRPERIFFTDATSLPNHNVVPAHTVRSTFCGSDRLHLVRLTNGMELHVRTQTEQAPAIGSAIQIAWPTEAGVILLT